VLVNAYNNGKPNPKVLGLQTLVTLTLSSNKDRYMSDLVDLQLKNKYMYAPNNVSVCYLSSFASFYE